jgi:hypothetical protein
MDRFMASPCRAVFVLALFCWAGCGGPTGPQQPDDLSYLVMNLADLAETEAGLKQVFAAGAVPQGAEGKRYARYMYNVVSSDTSGETAQLKVRLRDLNDAEVGRFDWTAIREDGKWKLKDAPLPPTK